MATALQIYAVEYKEMKISLGLKDNCMFVWGFKRRKQKSFTAIGDQAQDLYLG